MSADAHVEALWWLLTTPGYNKAFLEPGGVKSITGVDPGNFGLLLAHPETSTTRTFQAPTREELLDQIVAVMVEDKLAPQQKDPYAHLTELSKLALRIRAEEDRGR